MKMYLFKFLILSSVLVASGADAAQRNVKEKWPSPTPWLKDRLTDFLDQMPHNAKVVEVGVQGGGFAAFILRRTNPQQLFLIDCWEQQNPAIYDDPEANVANHLQERLYQETKARFAHDPRVMILKRYSKDAVGLFQDESLDWVYIDANHGYQAAKEDIALWWPKVKKGGYLSGHDYIVKESFGVVQAVNEFLVANNLSLKFLTNENSAATHNDHDSWAVQKPVNWK